MATTTANRVKAWVKITAITAALLFIIVGSCISDHMGNGGGTHYSPSSGPTRSECESRWDQQKDSYAVLGQDDANNHAAFINSCLAGS